MTLRKTRLIIEQLEDRCVPAPLAALPLDAIVVGDLGHGHAAVTWADLPKSKAGVLITPANFIPIAETGAQGVHTAVVGQVTVASNGVIWGT